MYGVEFSSRSANRILAWVVAAAVVAGFPSANSHAQEFNCTVAVNYSSLTGTDYSFLDDLRQRVFEYVNQRQWTEDRYRDFERIDCSIQIVMTEAISLTRFRARLVLASRRPIYGTGQQSTVLQLSDDAWVFDYAQGSPLIFEPDRYHSITSVLNFYAYIMLGFDYDSFSRMGGDPHFERARRISEIAQSSGAVGWSSMGGDVSRGQLISDIMNPRFRSLREGYFSYHFESLDHFIREPDRARTVLVDLLSNLASLREDVSRAYYLDQFFSAKYGEIAAMLKGSAQANQAFDALSKMDPAHISDYEAMLN
jgi:hypothetical protein